jgi:hypothetical protein
VQYFADPAAFRAVLLHELAHIRNGDIAVTYLSISVVLAFLATAMPTYIAVNLNHYDSAYDVPFEIAELCLVGACVLLPLKGVLRARELYADARSLAWHQDAATLAKVFATLELKPRGRRILSSHPAPARRRRLIDDTDEMFRFGTPDALGIGASAGFAAFTIGGQAWSIFLLVTGSLPAPGESDWIVAIPAVCVVLAIVPLTAGAMAIGAWRSAFLRLMRGTAGTSKFRIGIAFGTGLVIGGMLLGTIAVLASAAGIGSAAGIISPFGIGLPEAVGLVVLPAFVVILVLGIAAMMLLAWVEAAATPWLAVSLPRLVPGAPFAIGLGLCLLVAAAVSLGFPFAIGSSAVAMHERKISGSLAAFWLFGIAASETPISFISWPGVVAIWALPLSSALFARVSAERESWAFEPGATGRLPALPLFPGRAAALGAVCGSITVILTTWLSVPLSPDAVASSGLPPTPAAIGLLSHLVTSIAVVALMAMAVAFATPHLPIVHALCAGFFASIVMAAGEIIRMRLAGWQVPMSLLIDFTVPHLVFGGAIAALVAASAARCLAAVPGMLPSRLQPGLKHAQE